VRDIIVLFRARGIVQPIMVRGRAHPRYELTPTGIALQRLLWDNEGRS
jgi:hypothetical protein